MTAVSLRTARDLVDHYIEHNIPTFLWGPPGVGKSDMIWDIAKTREWKLIDFRALLREPVDLRGLPIPDLESGSTRWLVPDDLPCEKRDGKEGILFLDELNAAPQSVQAALFGLVLPPHRIGDYTLPKAWRIIGAGNRQSDRAAAQRMPSPLANRFAHIEIAATLEPWVTWAHTSMIPQQLIAFMRFRPNLLFSMEDSDLRAFPTPRSWAKAAEMLTAPPHLRLHLVAGLVGPGPAGELEAFLRNWADMPDLDFIIKSPDTAPIPDSENVSMTYAVCTALASRMTAENAENIAIYLTRLPIEFEISTWMDALYRNITLKLTKTFHKWAVKHHDILLVD